jgi:hypothetical protein
MEELAIAVATAVAVAVAAAAGEQRVAVFRLLIPLLLWSKMKQACGTQESQQLSPPN